MFCKGLVNMPKNIPTSTIVTSKWIQQGIINICCVHIPEILGDVLWEDDGIANSVPFRNLNGMRECENITTWDLRVNILCEAHACTSILNGASGCIHGRVPSRF